MDSNAFSDASIGLAFIVIGAVRGEANAVMQKAIMICMECIGLG